MIHFQHLIHGSEQYNTMEKFTCQGNVAAKGTSEKKLEMNQPKILYSC